jgi:hypothetical protein
VWKWGAEGHGVHFAERDAETAGARNSASDRAKSLHDSSLTATYGWLLKRPSATYGWSLKTFSDP